MRTLLLIALVIIAGCSKKATVVQQTLVDEKPVIEKPTGKTTVIEIPLPVETEEEFSRVEEVHKTVLFDFDSDEITPASQTALEELIVKIISGRYSIVYINGHACEIGTTQYNYNLGLRRANAVKNYFKLNGITTNMAVKSYGEKVPVSDDLKLNRRVEISTY